MQLVREFRQVGKPPDLLQALGKLWGQDKEVEKRLRWLPFATIGSGVATFFGLGILPKGGFPGLAVWVLLLAATITFARLWWHNYRMNLEDRRILTPIKFLEVIQADILPRDPVRLRVSFENYRQHGRKLEESGRGAGRSKYEDTWLEIEGWLAEKTRFHVAVSQRVSLAEKRKRKYTKSKMRVREEVSLYLRPNPKLYTGLERFPQMLPVGEQVAGLKVSSVRQSGRALVVTAEGGIYTKLSGRTSAETGTECLVNGDKLLLLMTAAYDRLNQCRAPAAAAG